MQVLTSKVKVQIIYFLNGQNELETIQVPDEKRLTFSQAVEFLAQQEKPVSEILKVKFEKATLQIPFDIAKDFLIFE